MGFFAGTAELRDMRILTFTAAVILAALFAAPPVLAQGAANSDMSFYDTSQFKHVQCMRHDGTNNEPVPGVLSFDASKSLSCGTSERAEFAVAYASVVRLVLSQGDASPVSSGWGFHALLSHKDMLKPIGKVRDLTIFYTDADGHIQSTAVRIEGADWKMIMAVAQNKTGHTVERSYKGDGW
jgi:hypothetical protein